MITSLPSIAILIDCWKSPTLNIDLENCYGRINNFLDNTDSIKTIVLASYNCKIEHEMGESIWYQNNKLMCGQSTRKKIPHLRYAHDYSNRYNNNNNYPVEETDPDILNYINPNKHQISMLWWWELEYYLLLHPEIKNIYFFGMAWEGCVRYRPLGYEAVIEEAPHLNILTNSNCILSEIHSNPTNIENDLDWTSIGNNIYHYQPISRSI